MTIKEQIRKYPWKAVGFAAFAGAFLMLLLIGLAS